MDEETRKQKAREYNRRWREKHREQWNAYMRNWQATTHNAKQRKMVNDYHQTKQGRATNLLTSYRQFDSEKFGVYPNLTQEDIIRICFSEDSKCVWCSESSWKKLGLDRIDNEKPHDVDNCVCSCHDCNVKRHRKSFDEWIDSRLTTIEECVKQKNSVLVMMP